MCKYVYMNLPTHFKWLRKETKQESGIGRGQRKPWSKDMWNILTRNHSIWPVKFNHHHYYTSIMSSQQKPQIL